MTFCLTAGEGVARKPRMLTSAGLSSAASFASSHIPTRSSAASSFASTAASPITATTATRTRGLSNTWPLEHVASQPCSPLVLLYTL